MTAVRFLNALVSAIPVLEVLATMTATRIDNWILDLAKRIRDDEEAMEQLSRWLISIPGLTTGPFPESLNEFRQVCQVLKEALKDANST